MINNETQKLDEPTIIETIIEPCGETIDLIDNQAIINPYGDGVFSIKLYIKNNINLTSYIFNGLINNQSTRLHNHEQPLINFSVNDLTQEGFNYTVYFNYTINNEPYQTVCNFSLEEEHYQLLPLISPINDSYLPLVNFNDPLNISTINQGPNNCTSLQKCINKCLNYTNYECRDWVHAIFNNFNINNQVNLSKVNGAWLPIINSVRQAVKLIPQLKNDGVNTLSFGPDIVTKHVEQPVIAGGDLYIFYVKLFEDAGFNINLVPNAMHWGNNNVWLNELNNLVIDWALIAESLNTKFYTLLNEVNGHLNNKSSTSEWIQQALPLVKTKYSGLICVQPTSRGFLDVDQQDLPRLNYSGFDCITSFYPGLSFSHGLDNVYWHINLFTNEVESVRSEFSNLKYVLFTDVATFNGSNWAEDGIIFDHLEGGVLANATSQEELITIYLDNVHPIVNGSFINNMPGSMWTGMPVESVIRESYTKYSETIPSLWTDELWTTNGLLELIEQVLIKPEEKEQLFDLNTYVPGDAGLCIKPSIENPGPFNCTSISECMNQLKTDPINYWAWKKSNCYQ